MAKPKLRFPEFADEWKEYRISEVFDRVVNPVTVEKNKCYKQIGIRSHGKGLFYKEEVTGEELGNKRVFWVEPDCFVVNIVFAWERAVAKLTEAERGMIASHRFPMYKPKDQVLDLDYITEYFTTFYGQKILILASPGGAGRNKTLGQEEFAKSKIRLPSYVEQKKIAKFLFTVDDLIQVLEEEISALEEQKKAIMQKLFNHEVRFKADDGSEYPEWEEKELEQIANIFDGTHQTPEYVNEGIPFVSVEDINNLYRTNKYITEEAFNKEFKIYPQQGDILMTRIGSIGVAAIITKDIKMAYYVSLALLKLKEKVNTTYLLQYILCEKFQQELWKRTLHIAFPKKINKNEIGKCKVNIPCLEEQQKIADCLSAYDDAIQIKKDKLGVWKEIKKGLLQQMFV